ncbi:MAG: DUF948 domain-containing protein [Eubacteriaceae bacterium]|jgi:uncharacterized protein YoxC|nr:DUF948 domain-containing protein [Eubacteriaceae bacterium]
MVIQDVIQLLTLVVVASLGTAITIYLVLALKKLTQTMNRLDMVVSENSEQIASIMENVNSITADANDIVGKVTSTVSGINKVVEGVNKQSAIDNVANAKKAFDVAKFVWGGFQFMKERRQRKDFDKLLKEAKSK